MGHSGTNRFIEKVGNSERSPFAGRLISKQPLATLLYSLCFLKHLASCESTKFLEVKSLFFVMHFRKD